MDRVLRAVEDVKALPAVRAAMDHVETTTRDAIAWAQNNKEIQLALARATEYAETARMTVNERLAGFEPWQIVALSLVAFYIANRIRCFVWQEESVSSRFKKSFFAFVKGLPIIRGLIAKEMAKNVRHIEESMFKSVPEGYVHMSLPSRGLTNNEIFKELEYYRDMGDVHWEQGKVSGTVYHGGKDITALAEKVYGMFAWSNPLHPDVFPGIRKMEAEVVEMVLRLYNGKSGVACGTMTSGGTESIIMACKAYRDRGYERGIKHPEMVIPVSAHAAFDKAASYFNIKLVHVPVDEKTRRVNVRAMARAITKNTVMIVGSCPSFPHGVIDPIPELSKLALRRGVGLHVDCCLGGFLVPFMKAAGFEIPEFDFRLPGVTSISCDTHKYGFSPKGSSIVMYHSQELRHYQYFVAPNWTGGIYASPSIAGSRPGAIIAATWATLMHFGKEGYIDSTKKIVGTAKKMEKELRKVPGIKVMGSVDVSVVALGSDDFDIYQLGQQLTARGWNLNSLQFPSSIHLCVTYPHTQGGAADNFVKDVRSIAESILRKPREKSHGSAAMYGMAQSIPDRSVINQMAFAFIDAMYNARGPQIADEIKKEKTENGKH